MVRPAETVVALLKSKWDKSKIKLPQVEKITKSVQRQIENTDWILVRELPWMPKVNTLSMKFSNDDWIVRIDARTRADTRLDKIRTNIEKVMNEYNTAIPGYSYGFPESGNDLSDERKPIFRYVYEYRIVKVGVVLK